MRTTVQMMCMTCPERLSDHDDDGGKYASVRLEVLARSLGWVHIVRVPRHEADVCAECARVIASVVAGRLHASPDAGKASGPDQPREERTSCIPTGATTPSPTAGSVPQTGTNPALDPDQAIFEAACLLVFAMTKIEEKLKGPTAQWFDDARDWLGQGCDCERFEGGEHSALCNSRIATAHRHHRNALLRRSES